MVIIGIDPGVRFLGWCVYKNKELIMGTIKSTKPVSKDFLSKCIIIQTVSDQLIDICKEHGVTKAIIETQGPRVHYSVHCLVGMLYSKLLLENITVTFLSPQSFMKLGGPTRIPTKDERAEKVFTIYKNKEKHLNHATDAAFLVLHEEGVL